MANKQKLELNWIGKENRPKLKPLEAEFAGKVKCVFIRALQHRQCLHALRRRGAAFDLTAAGARPAGDYPAVAVGLWQK